MSEGADGSKTVLVVEDESPVADLFEDALSQDYDVHVARDGAQAISMLGDDVDIVLLDRRMPDVSGDQVLSEIEQRALDCRSAIVSAVDPDFDIIDMGFDDYLVKPVRPAELRATVERLELLDDLAAKHQELSSKLVKRNILEVEKGNAELQDNGEFRELTDRIEELRAELEAHESEFDDRLLPS
jgi:two-component system response regulator AdeR